MERRKGRLLLNECGIRFYRLRISFRLTPSLRLNLFLSESLIPSFPVASTCHGALPENLELGDDGLLEYNGPSAFLRHALSLSTRRCLSYVRYVRGSPYISSLELDAIDLLRIRIMAILSIFISTMKNSPSFPSSSSSSSSSPLHDEIREVE